MAGFVQIVEFRTSRIKEIEALGRPLRTEGSNQNSARPETSEFAAKMAALCDGPVVFHSLDPIWEDTGDGAGHG